MTSRFKSVENGRMGGGGGIEKGERRHTSFSLQSISKNGNNSDLSVAFCSFVVNIKMGKKRDGGGG